MCIKTNLKKTEDVISWYSKRAHIQLLDVLGLYWNVTQTKTENIWNKNIQMFSHQAAVIL